MSLRKAGRVTPMESASSSPTSNRAGQPHANRFVHVWRRSGPEYRGDRPFYDALEMVSELIAANIQNLGENIEARVGARVDADVEERFKFFTKDLDRQVEQAAHVIQSQMSELKDALLSKTSVLNGIEKFANTLETNRIAVQDLSNRSASELQAMMSEVRSLADKLQDVGSLPVRLTDYDKVVRGQSATLQQLERQMNALESQVEQKLQSDSQRHASVKSELRQVESALKETQELLEPLRGPVDELSTFQHDLKKKHQLLRSDVNELGKDLKDLTTSLKAGSALLETLKSTELLSLQTTCHEFTKSVQSANESLNRMPNKLNDRFGKLAEAHDNCEESLRKLSHILQPGNNGQGLAAGVQGLFEEVERVKEQVKGLQSIISNGKGDLEHLCREGGLLSAFKTSCKRCNDSLEDVDRRVTKLDQSLGGIDDLEYSRESLLKKLRKLDETLDDGSGGGLSQSLKQLSKDTHSIIGAVEGHSVKQCCALLKETADSCESLPSVAKNLSKHSLELNRVLEGYDGGSGSAHFLKHLTGVTLQVKYLHTSLVEDDFVRGVANSAKVLDKFQKTSNDACVLMEQAKLEVTPTQIASSVEATVKKLADGVLHTSSKELMRQSKEACDKLAEVRSQVEEAGKQIHIVMDAATKAKDEFAQLPQKVVDEYQSLNKKVEDVVKPIQDTSNQVKEGFESIKTSFEALKHLVETLKGGLETLKGGLALARNLAGGTLGASVLTFGASILPGLTQGQ